MAGFLDSLMDSNESKKKVRSSPQSPKKKKKSKKTTSKKNNSTKNETKKEETTEQKQQNILDKMLIRNRQLTLLDEFEQIKTYLRTGNRPSQKKAIENFEKHLQNLILMEDS